MESRKRSGLRGVQRRNARCETLPEMNVLRN
jgi:hypothetical protein